MRRPRTKSLSRPKAGQFLWLKAIRIIDALKDKPGALRLAGELADLYNPDRGFAYPSRDYLASELGSDKAAISTWTSVLRDCGAIETMAQGKLHPDLRTSRDPRSLVYVLNLDWAVAVIAAHEARTKLSGKAPPRRQPVVDATTEPVVDLTIDVGCGSHNTYNLNVQTSDNRGQDRRDDGGVSYRARTLRELPEDAPDDEMVGKAWLARKGLNENEVDHHIKALMAGQFFMSDIPQIIDDREPEDPGFRRPSVRNGLSVPPKNDPWGIYKDAYGSRPR